MLTEQNKNASNSLTIFEAFVNLQTVVQAIAKLFKTMNNTVHHWPAKSLLHCSESLGWKLVGSSTFASA